MLVNKIQMERIALEPVLSSWANALASGTGTDASDSTISSESNMKSVAAFLSGLTFALAEAQPDSSTSAATLVGYQTSVNTGRLNVSAALSALISADTAYKAATGALMLAQAGATANDILAQKAAVDAAQASVDAAMATASQAVIIAPVSGTITAQNANLGETVVPSVPLVSMIADGKYEADAQISETDIAKVKLNDKVKATFAGYPGANFDAKVTTVAPSAIMNGGVTAYPVTVTFFNNDARLLPGLSANLHIITATKDATLVVPSSAIVTNGSQEFVYVKSTNGNVATPVTTGIKSADGMTEILSGLTAGDQILAFGASASQ